MKIYEIRVRRALTPSGLPEYDYALNPYVGCLHGCLYCYAQDYTKGPPGAAWGHIVYVKANLLEVLRREAAQLKPGVVGLSTVTDPYQPPEAKYRLARGAIEILAEAGFHISVQTKSPLVLRDLDLFKRYRESVDVGITITAMGDKALELEPAAPHPTARARAAARLAEEGVKVWIFLGPVVPGYNDSREDLAEVIKLAASIGAELIYDRYRPKPKAHARLPPAYRQEAGTQWWTQVKKTIEELCREAGARCLDVEEEWRARRGRPPLEAGLDGAP
ncbi:SPL family radical SAM protein [Pyrobaculum islandicum]|uniref:SPL family radical SAM protein n=1 Tax=Pyrobaculum islandicum TaxID=2277 RepID=UPI00069F0376|nr:radical SAM protein [Pyrobaculum islandicum]